MSYQKVLDWIKTAGFEQWSWVIAVLIGLVIFLKWMFGSTKQSASAVSLSTGNAANQHSAVGQQIGGTGNVVIQNNADPGHTQITLQLLNAIEQKDKLLAEKDARILALSVSQIQDRKDAVATVVEEATKLHPTTLALQAKQEMLSGNVDAAVQLLFSLSDDAAAQALPHLRSASTYAREAGALLANRDITRAIAAYERVLQREPNDLPTLDALIFLYTSAGNSPQARVLADRLLGLTQARAKTDPTNTQWQRDLSVSYERIGDLQNAEGKRPEALASYQAGLAIAKSLAELDKANTEWQTDLVVSAWKISALVDAKAAKHMLQDALKTLARLDATGALRADQKDWPAMLQQRLDSLK